MNIKSNGALSSIKEFFASGKLVHAVDQEFAGLEKTLAETSESYASAYGKRQAAMEAKGIKGADLDALNAKRVNEHGDLTPVYTAFGNAREALEGAGNKHLRRAGAYLSEDGLRTATIGGGLIVGASLLNRE